MIYVRVDDFPNTKGEPQHTLEAFREFDRALRTYMPEGRYLLGVIPKRCTPEDLVFLRNETNCRIGMHGIHHDEQLLDVHGNEFPSYLPRIAVREQLKENRQMLERALDRCVNIYMPPRNRIDRRTLEVLEGAGFEQYTTGPETPEEFRTGRLARVHYLDSQPPHEYGRTDEMYLRRSYMELNQRAQQVKLPIYLTLHWTWETNVGLDHLHRFMEQIQTNLGRF